jgi:hypothetical protein
MSNDVIYLPDESGGKESGNSELPNSETQTPLNTKATANDLSPSSTNRRGFLIAAACGLAAGLPLGGLISRAFSTDPPEVFSTELYKEIDRTRPHYGKFCLLPVRDVTNGSIRMVRAKPRGHKSESLHPLVLDAHLKSLEDPEIYAYDDLSVIRTPSIVDHLIGHAISQEKPYEPSSPKHLEHLKLFWGGNFHYSFRPDRYLGFGGGYVLTISTPSQQRAVSFAESIIHGRVDTFYLMGKGLKTETIDIRYSYSEDDNTQDLAHTDFRASLSSIVFNEKQRISKTA